MECERLILLLMFEYFYVSERGRELSGLVSGHWWRLTGCYRFLLDGGLPGPGRQVAARGSACVLNVWRKMASNSNAWIVFALLLDCETTLVSDCDYATRNCLGKPVFKRLRRVASKKSACCIYWIAWAVSVLRVEDAENLGPLLPLCCWQLGA